jgi:hypothetical protein
VVVLEGVTCCVPPFPGSVYALPSEPLNETLDAFVAEMVNIDELPALIAAGFAETLIAGDGEDPCTKWPELVPHALKKVNR